MKPAESRLIAAHSLVFGFKSPLKALLESGGLPIFPQARARSAGRPEFFPGLGW